MSAGAESRQDNVSSVFQWTDCVCLQLPQLTDQQKTNIEVSLWFGDAVNYLTSDEMMSD